MDIAQGHLSSETGLVTRPPLSPTARSTIRRNATRAELDRSALTDVLKAGLVCHLGFVINGSPVVLPTGYGYDDDTLYLHGSSGAGSLRAAAEGIDVSVAITLLDGIVYARSVFHHSVNYRSAVIHGSAVTVEGPAKLDALRVITEHLAPGSWDATRQPTAKELAKTVVLALDLTEASVKVRTGPPIDDEDDVTGNPTWAGVLPLHTSWGEAEPCPLVPAGTEVPPRVHNRPTPFHPASPN